MFWQKIAAAGQINPVLDDWIKQRRITWEEVRTERKILATMVFADSDSLSNERKVWNSIMQETRVLMSLPDRPD